ncbi:hypothetical protein AVEN_114485-1 [Araneus ventricosus]|uniref:Uncharacterized protein n=1 Tax=Araneus ventricosus TaxID=182803 RepID=A0A4Y2PR98_ARAVE|nr:hypothetical protein AVEN_114485-1 [Araneus ventricosus]
MVHWPDGAKKICQVTRRGNGASGPIQTNHKSLRTQAARGLSDRGSEPLGISTQPFCPLCDSGEVMERDHLLRCGSLQGLTEVSRYWEARALWGNDFGLLFLLHVLL